MTTRTAARRLVRLIAAGALAATSLAVSPSGPAGATDGTAPETHAAPTWQYSADEPIPDGDIAARAIGESISHTEAERRLRADRAASRIDDAASSRWPQTFAGLWIDHDPYRINVAFTRDAAANVAELRESFPYPEDLHPVDAAQSLDALTLLQAKVAHDRDALQRQLSPAGMPAEIRATGGRYDHTIDVRASRVLVRVARPTTALRGAFENRYGGLVVVTNGRSMPRACTQADCRYAMMGGLRLALGNTARWCSSAFTAQLKSDPSYRYVLSAAHCYTETSTTSRSNAGAYYGLTTSHRQAYEVDAERVRRGDTPWRESSKVYVQGETYPRNVNNVINYADLETGMYIGKTGYTTGTTRGYITFLKSAPWWVTSARNFVEADMCVDGGDSGGAVWSGNTAYGIVSGSYTDTICRNINGVESNPVGDAGTAIFGAISFATSALGVSILTGVNLAPSAEFTSTCLLLDCTFDGSASADQDGGITSWTWNFGDGTTGTGMRPTHSYALPGLYTVTLTTKDNNGATASRSTGIVVTSS